MGGGSSCELHFATGSRPSMRYSICAEDSPWSKPMSSYLYLPALKQYRYE